MRLDHFLAMFPQYISMFLLFCMFTNLLSIYAPFHVAAGFAEALEPEVDHGSLATGDVLRFSFR